MGGAIISESGGGIIPLQGGGIIPELGGGFLRNQQFNRALLLLLNLGLQEIADKALRLVLALRRRSSSRGLSEPRGKRANSLTYCR